MGESVGITYTEEYVSGLKNQINELKEQLECLKAKHDLVYSDLLKATEELKKREEKMEALRAEKAALDILYAGRGGMIEAYEYALDAIAGRNNKC